MKKQLFISLFLLGLGFYWTACSADQLPEPGPDKLDCDQTSITYNAHIKGILDANCNTSGCHDNQNLGQFGDYSTIGMPRLQNIYNRAVVSGDMPPQGMPRELRDSIDCWASQGYLEN